MVTAGYSTPTTNWPSSLNSPGAQFRDYTHSPDVVKEFLSSNADVLDDLSLERRRDVSA